MQFKRERAGWYVCRIARMSVEVRQREDNVWYWQIIHPGQPPDGPHDLYDTRAEAIDGVERYIARNMEGAR